MKRAPTVLELLRAGLRFLFVIAFSQAIAGPSAIAQNVPGTPFRGAWYYFTHDETQIQVRLYAGSPLPNKLERGD